jgi:hypothetical protein
MTEFATNPTHASEILGAVVFVLAPLLALWAISARNTRKQDRRDPIANIATEAREARHLRYDCRGCRWQRVATPGGICSVCIDWHTHIDQNQGGAA